MPKFDFGTLQQEATTSKQDIEKQVWAFLETRQEISQLFFIFEDYKIFKE